MLCPRFSRIAGILLLALASCGGGAQVSTSDRMSESPDTEKLLKPSELVDFDTAPKLISMGSPAYPDEARERGVEGVVLVRALVGKDGVVTETMVLQGVHELIDQEAIRVVRTSKWKPALKGKKPVAAYMVIPIEFSLGAK